MGIFSKINVKKPRKTVHQLSYSSQFSLPFGRLVPIMCEKVVPGDKFVHSHEFLMRFAPFVGQVFQSFQVRTAYFFVPSRLLWDNFERFLIEDDPSVYPHPQFQFSKIYDGQHDMTGTLVDYFNLPTVEYYSDGQGGINIAPIDGSQFTNGNFDCLPFAAYLKIFLDYYADENLFQNLANESYLDFFDEFEETLRGANGTNYGNIVMQMLRSVNRVAAVDAVDEWFQPFMRAYPKDYFTSALPWAQRGPLVQIPLNGEGDISIQGVMGDNRKYHDVAIYYDGTGPTTDEVDVTLYPKGITTVGTQVTSALNVSTGNVTNGIESSSQVENANGAAQAQAYLQSQRTHVPLTFKAVNVNGTATINDLRTAIAVQRWLEVNARAGVRYKEQLMSHFGVRSRDYRLDRAELLQRTKSTVSIGEVFTTAANDTDTFVPGLGVSTATGSSAVRPFKRFFEEHGYVIGLMSVFPTASYSQGIPRQFLELDKFDYYWPEFQGIGEQEIYQGEVCVHDTGDIKGTFGYTPRYAHYKNRPNQVHGDFRKSLNFMHDGRLFANSPALNQDFINVDVAKNDLNRVFNVKGQYTNSYPIYVDMFHKFRPIRPMDYFGTPRIL